MLRSLLVALVLVLLPAPLAQAASGSMTDPAGDFPDIVKLTYANKSNRVVMTMTYSGSRPQNESFYMRWGTNAGKHYQVFRAAGNGKQLRLNGTAVPCGSLVVTHDPSTRVTRTEIPRACLSAAPDKLRFQGTATEGLFGRDDTALSGWIVRG